MKYCNFMYSCLHIVICLAKFQDLRGKEDEETRYQESCSIKVRATSHHCGIGKLARMVE